MRLNYQRFGSGHPLIILHGLYGCGDNWLTIGKSLSGICEIILVDQRNHGASPRSDEHRYRLLAEDLKELMDELDIRQAAILGHSMGGKAAMWFAVEHPGRVSLLMIADISPRSYLHDSGPSNHIKQHLAILEALEGVDLDQVSSIGDADRQLLTRMPDKRLRQFMLKNLSKSDEGIWSWKINLPAIKRNLNHLADGLDLESLDGKEYRQFPVLFIKGGESPYIQEKDKTLIKNIFPLAQLVTMKNAGHWLHAEDPSTFTSIVRNFILQPGTA